MGVSRIVILTGAGVSADSGVSTFRDPDGVWSKVDVNEVATPEGFAADPEKVHAFYNARRAGLADVAPNAAHFALAELEAGLNARGGRLTLVTQNVDDLHERAGSKNLVHMHGELAKARCTLCGAVTPWLEPLSVATHCPNCGGSGGMRPHVVWFGEMPLYLDEIEDALLSAELFVSIGTSGSVYPAAGYVSAARQLGLPTLELNLEPSENASLFTDGRYGKAAEIVPQWVGNILSA
ncbi:MAG: NAD-dependent deacylase [Pseudomonadota bacterium]